MALMEGLIKVSPSAADAVICVEVGDPYYDFTLIHQYQVQAPRNANGIIDEIQLIGPR